MLLAFALLTLPSFAQDQITRNDNKIIVGTITGVAGGQVSYSQTTATGGVVKVSLYLTDIKSVTMPVPPEVAKINASPNPDPTQAIAVLEPVVRQFAGLPCDWVGESMAKLAEAYAAAGKADLAANMYAQIKQLYPNSGILNLAIASLARQSLKAGKIPEAIAALKPTVDKANANLAPSPADARLYADVFLVYGQALEAEKQLPQALEAYLTVKTMFYQNPALAAQADLAAKNLRAQNPGLGVD
jgi:hypothetical protein